MLWILIVLAELNSAWAFFAAVWQLFFGKERPQGGESGLVQQIRQFAWDTEVFVFEKINKRQFLCVVVVFVLRITIAGTLGFVGARWLSRTTSIRDLVLNGAALAWVFEIDTITYHICIPQRMQRILSNVQPLQRTGSSKSPKNVGDTVRASTAMPRETMDDLGITADDEGEVIELDTADVSEVGEVSVRWKKLPSTTWCNKAHLQVI